MNKQMTKQNYRKSAMKAYRIEFGSDNYLYSVSFQAAADTPKICELLDAARSCLYENLQEAIRSYLDAHCPGYTGFTSTAARLEHNAVMASADRLLYNSTCTYMDSLSRGADEYYGIMDHQLRMDERRCEGCYYAVSKTSSGQKGISECHIIGQTFQYDTKSDKEQAFFAIRKNAGDRLHTLQAANCPVLSPFGCVDLAGLLISLPSITTKEQAAEIANR